MDDEPDAEGRRVYRMSELGGCTKAMVAKQLDYQKLLPPSFIKKKFDEGTAIEPKVIELLRSRGWLVENTQATVDIEVTPHVVLRGHIDGTGGPRADTVNLIDAQEIPWHGVIEIKSMTEKEFAKFKKDGWSTPGLVQKYKWQFSAYMWALGMRGRLVVINRDADNFDTLGENIIVSEVDEPFLTKGELVAKVLEADRHYRLDELPAQCDFPNWPCPFVYLHEEVWDTTDEDLEAVAVAYKAATAKETTGKKEKAELRAVMDAASGRKSYKSERVTITYFDKKNPAQLNRDMLEAVGLDPKQYENRQTSNRQVRVTLHELGDADAAS